jgi:tetratricopeptide (TPR) repeat protein
MKQAGFLALGVLAACAAAMAQDQSMGGMAMSGPMPGMHAIPPPEKLPVPVKMTGIGNSHITIKASPEAQMWFDQGLNLLHDFWDYESTKAFEQGVRVDPNCAMCYWGLAQVEGFRGGPEKVYGSAALAKAVQLKGHESSAGKMYIEAAEAGANAKPGDSHAEIEVWRKLVKKHPEEMQARIFLATALQDGYDDKGEPKAGQKEAIAALEGVLHDAPNDSAANHYWIHAMEPSNHPERAIPSAQLLASLAPTSGHMVHMPGHIFYRVGDYKDADHWFSESTATDERYMHEQHVGPDDDWNYVHNMMYGIANLMEQGRIADAYALSDRLAGARGELPATLYTFSARNQMARLNNRLPVALRVGDWAGVIAMVDQAPAGDPEKTKNLRFLQTELRDFAVGMQALAEKDVAGAEAASARLDAGLWRQQQEQDAEAKMKMDAAKSAPAMAKKDEPPMIPIMPDADPTGLSKYMGIASLELRAGVLAAKGRLDDAKKLYAEAAKDEKALGYREPPLYVRPVGENEGSALLAARDYAGAKTAFDAALVERPNSGFGLYGLAQVKELSGDQAGARAGYQAFLKAWPTADAGMPEVTHARQVLEGAAAVASRD